MSLSQLQKEFKTCMLDYVIRTMTKAKGAV